MKKRSRSFVLAWIFGAISLILAVSLVMASLIIVKLQRNNLFSKSILLDNNYFMGQVMYSAHTGTDSTSDIGDEHEYDEGEGEHEYNIYSEGPMIQFIRYGDDGHSFIVSEAVEPETAEKLKVIFDYMKEKYAVYAEDITASNVILNNLNDIYKIWGHTPEGDTEAEAFLMQFDIELDIDSLIVEESALIDVPYISQEGILPNGCEAVSATMLLRYFNFDITAEEFVDEYLECGETYISFGCRIGPNPKEVYAGDPRSEDGGFGCFAPVIVRALNKYLPEGYYAKNTTGMSLEALKQTYIDNGIPVAVWVTIEMEEVDRILQWQSEDRKETYLYPANEHCMVLVGYDNENYIFADPYDSNGVVSYPIEDCVLAFNMLGSQSVAIIDTSSY